MRVFQATSGKRSVARHFVAIAISLIGVRADLIEAALRQFRPLGAANRAIAVWYCGYAV